GYFGSGMKTRRGRYMRIKRKEIRPCRASPRLIIIIFTVIWVSILIAGFHVSAARAEDNRSLTNTRNSLPVHEMTASPAIDENRSSISRPSLKRANFKKVNKSRAAQNVADWVVDSGDNYGMPFIIVDKIDAKVFVFNADGQLRDSAPALLGLARGDDSFPGIGDRHLSAIRPKERTTPAGRFVGSLGHNADGSSVLWVDHEKAVSLHRVITDQPRERRLQRLASPTPLDNRISYGCINVPAQFFDDVVRPVLADTKGVIYILPETRSNSEIFTSYYEVE
ncbi:MAG: hypothetical protein H6Q52_1737, partial [Deltaproteobacteria bacterium]|nr:hypothetical protein [Deltaproteobacteria bacterium]